MLVLEHQQVERALVTLLDPSDQLGVGGLSCHEGEFRPQGRSANHLPGRQRRLRKVRMRPHKSWILVPETVTYVISLLLARFGRQMVSASFMPTKGTAAVPPYELQSMPIGIAP